MVEIWRIGWVGKTVRRPGIADLHSKRGRRAAYKPRDWPPRRVEVSVREPQAKRAAVDAMAERRRKVHFLHFQRETAIWSDYQGRATNLLERKNHELAEEQRRFQAELAALREGTEARGCA